MKAWSNLGLNYFLSSKIQNAFTIILRLSRHTTTPTMMCKTLARNPTRYLSKANRSAWKCKVNERVKTILFVIHSPGSLWNSSSVASDLKQSSTGTSSPLQASQHLELEKSKKKTSDLALYIEINKKKILTCPAKCLTRSWRWSER